MKPVRPKLPELDVTVRRWAKNEIDLFILARLQREDLSFSPEADRYTLIRRVSLDLTGLPPTPDEVHEFVSNTSPSAYEEIVDRLLHRPTFGEHWARMWLDLARYADSAGYADDPHRTIWAYRDWVIHAINTNLPFDQFTLAQIAGDLLPDPTPDQLIATAFHRNTMTNNEGGTNDEEFRNVAVVDRTNTTMSVWMGTTMACAQCHNHKYDPISQQEYFRFFAILNNTEDADRRDESPLYTKWTEERLQKKAAWKEEIAVLEKTLQTVTPNLRASQAKWEERFRQDSSADEFSEITPAIAEILKLAGEDRSEEKQAELTKFYLTVSAELKPARDRLTELREKLGQLQPNLSVPIMRELSGENRRTTRVQHRGNYLDVGTEVTVGLPAALHGRDDGELLNRLTLAHWLVDQDNPLTARVVVNRYWEAIFGVGLVETSEEFGTQGDPPSHPKLLDWLATEFVRLNWDAKSMIRRIVTSATYRQSSRVTPRLLERDADNRLLTRGPRFRMSAESIRDQALFVSGLLSPKMFGPPVRPVQPELGTSAAFGTTIDWETSEGEDRYRRGVYTAWRRSSPYPSMATFDAPNREVCTIRRSRTNTPLQALVTLNDPVYVEAARALACQFDAFGESASDRVAVGFRRCLSRPPRAEELDHLVQLYEAAHARFQDQTELALALTNTPREDTAGGSRIVELAAWTIVANVLLNLDEMFLKR